MDIFEQVADVYSFILGMVAGHKLAYGKDIRSKRDEVELKNKGGGANGIERKAFKKQYKRTTNSTR